MRRSDLMRLPLLALVAATWHAQAATLAEIKQRGYLVVAVSSEATPFASVADGKPAGFDARLIEALARSVPFEIRREPTPPAEMAASLASGKADIAAASVEVTVEQQKSLDFSAPLAEATVYYLKRKNDDHIHTVGDLSKRRFGDRSSSASIPQLTEFEHVLAKAGGKLGESVDYDSYAEAFKDLAAKKIDFVIGDIADLLAATQSKPETFEIGQPVSRKTYVAWRLAKGNDDLAKFLSDFLVTEKKNGDLSALQQKWIGRAFPDLPDNVNAQDWWVARSDKPAIYPIPTRKDPD